MTRVSDALAKAAGDSAEEIPGVEPGKRLSIDGVSEGLWQSEAHADPGLQTGPVMRQPHDRSAPPPAVVPGATTDEKLVTGSIEPGPVEQYRRLAARLHLSQTERGTKVVMITSAIASEGKTLTASNLALTLSESYKRRVLLIDADLRHPWVHELFRLPNVTGLNDGIRADSDRKVPLIAISEYLSVLTAGRPDPDPMSVLTSERMQRVLQDAARSFDWVIVDTPPVGVLSDARLLATLVDTVVLVVKAGSTQFSAMKQAVEAVGRDRIMGVVLNCADEATLATDYYYGYGYLKRSEQTPA